MRAFWRWLIDTREDHERITGQILAMPINWGIDDTINAVRVLLQAGYQTTQQLVNICGNAWPTRDSRIAQTIECICDHVTKEAQLARDRAGVLASIERILHSAECMEPKTIRPSNEGPAKAVRSARISEWTQEEKRRRLDDDAGYQAQPEVPGTRVQE